MTRLADHHSLPDAVGLLELDSNLEHLGFSLARVGHGASVEAHSGADEMLVVVLNAHKAPASKRANDALSCP